jgi:hypothetical protein
VGVWGLSSSSTDATLPLEYDSGIASRSTLNSWHATVASPHGTALDNGNLLLQWVLSKELGFFRSRAMISAPENVASSCTHFASVYNLPHSIATVSISAQLLTTANTPAPAYSCYPELSHVLLQSERLEAEVRSSTRRRTVLWVTHNECM